ncbi:MAG: hypothetical protein C0179_04935 [Fervidicoccus sp.]|nr:MAG: hypothetical protein C0179_04935 [Fervidicoccus sp.]
MHISEDLFGRSNCKRYKVMEGYVSMVLSIIDRRCRRMPAPYLSSYLCPEDTINMLIKNYCDMREERCE